MEEEIKDTKLYRINLQKQILREVCRKWLEVLGTNKAPVINYRELPKKWNVPEEILMRVVQEKVDEGLVEDDGTCIMLTPKGREECERRKFT